MKSTSFTIKLFLKVERQKKDGTATIYARLRLDGNKMELTSNKNATPEQWNDKAGKVIKHPDSRQLNKYLEAFVSKINNAYSQLFIAQQHITLEAIRSLVLGLPAKEKSVTLLSVATEHNVQFEQLIGVKYSYGSYKNYKSTLKYLIEFIPLYTHKKDIPLSGVNYRFCEAYFSYLTTSKQCHTNGANKQLQRLKKIINYAIKLGYIQTNPMASYTLEFEPVDKVALTQMEIQQLFELDLKRPVLQHVRDIFLIQCFTGLSYSDIKLLAPEHISLGQNDTYWIRMRRQKTKVSFAIPLLQPALLILDTYIKSPGYPILPVLSNQKMNENLKLIQELAGIHKNLTTHLARHTFATTITLSNGVPLETVSKMLGHTKLSTTQIYAKVLDSKIDNDMKYE